MGSKIITGKIVENPYGNWSDVDTGWYIGYDRIDSFLNSYEGKNVRITIEIIPEVEKILNYKQISGRPYYLVKWKGYDTSENTWEPIAHLDGCHQKVKEFHQQKDRRFPRRRKAQPTTPPESD